MSTIKTFLPAEEVDSFKKFANNTKKNVEGFTYSVGKPYEKLFRHPVIDENGMAGHCIKAFHEVCDLVINMPEESDWRLLATYKDGAFMPTDPSKELIFKNPEHGIDYGKCDYCGHWCKNAYVIENVKTGEELQIGCECVKKFGLGRFDYLSDFTRKLYKLYDYRINYATDEEYGDMLDWGGKKKDVSYKDARLKSEMIMAAKMEYDKCPVWSKAEKKDGVYRPSQTAYNIEARMNATDGINVDESYVKKVCDYALRKNAESEFEVEMQKVAIDYYVYTGQIVYVFFMVRNYEESLKKINVEKGMQVKVIGKVILKRYEESYYGVMCINTILTDKGVTCERVGKIPYTTPDEKNTEFYSIVKSVYHGKVYLERATKNPKKGLEVVSI
jgi:hypothetical protein